MFSACCCSWLWVLNFDSFVTPSTSRATSGPNRSSMSVEAVLGVLGDVVEERRGDRDRVDPELGGDLGRRDRVGDVRLAGRPALALVGLDGEVERLLDRAPDRPAGSARGRSRRAASAWRRDPAPRSSRRPRSSVARGAGPWAWRGPSAFARRFGRGSSARRAGLGGRRRGPCRAATPWRRRASSCGLGHRPKDSSGRMPSAPEPGPGPSQPPSSGRHVERRVEPQVAGHDRPPSRSRSGNDGSRLGRSARAERRRDDERAAASTTRRPSTVAAGRADPERVRARRARRAGRPRPRTPLGTRPGRRARRSPGRRRSWPRPHRPARRCSIVGGRRLPPAVVELGARRSGPRIRSAVRARTSTSRQDRGSGWPRGASASRRPSPAIVDPVGLGRGGAGVADRPSP